MRLAWFHPATHVSDRLDDSAALVAALGREHDIEVFSEARAHDFIRLDFRTPFDLCVFELADTRQHAYVWPYLLHVPGVLRLRSATLHESRSDSLRRQRREGDRSAELAFGDWELAAAPILASRLTVVSDAYTATRLERAYPLSAVRHVPLGMGSDLEPASGQSPQVVESRHQRGQLRDQTPTVGAVESGAVRRAFARATAAGAQLELITGAPDQILDRADVVIAMSWPPTDELALALAAMAHRLPVIVFETERTAGWPALDPQTWQPRGWTGSQPIVISIDPRDEEHSLSLALRRLAGDPDMRRSLGTAGYLWWRQHATLDHAVGGWRKILDEAVGLAPPSRPPNWPPHLTADGTERARTLLTESGVSVDFL